MSDEDPSSAIEGNQQKFKWIYELLGDTGPSPAAKAVGVGTALKMAGRKGYFKASRKAIAKLCGVSLSTVNRAFVELAAQNYWEIDYKTGGANIFTLIMPDRRVEMWLRSEIEYRRNCNKWLFAESRGIQEWLDAERRYRSRIEYERGEGALSEAQSGRGGDACQASFTRSPVTTPPCHIEGGGLSDLGRGIVNVDKGGLSGPVIPLVTASVLTSGNDQNHKSLESTLKVPERDLKVPRNDDQPPGAPGGTPSAGASRCELCDDNGIFTDPDGFPVVLLEKTDSDTFKECKVECKHSMDANLVEIQRIEKVSNGYWGASKTGWKKIDEHYGFDDYDFGDGEI